jgi:hypothetical protein
MHLVSRDDDILRTLALRVRLLSLAQVAEGWWEATDAGRTNARRRLAKLAQSGLIGRLIVPARPLPPLDAPTLAWRPGEGTPDFGAVAWRLQSRWKEGPMPTVAYIATRRGANQYGGRLRGRIRRELQVTHDLGVSAVYLRMRALNLEATDAWIGEDVLSPERRGEKLPDAVIADSLQSPPRLVVEFGGAYDAERVRRFHEDCAERQLPYELW